MLAQLPVTARVAHKPSPGLASLQKVSGLGLSSPGDGRSMLDISASEEAKTVYLVTSEHCTEFLISL